MHFQIYVMHVIWRYIHILYPDGFAAVGTHVGISGLYCQPLIH